MKQLKVIKRWVLFFIIALIISGATALPLETELYYLLRIVQQGTRLHNFLLRVYNAIIAIKEQHPFLLYGYDWLAFAHFLFAILFIGVYKDPVKNSWIVQFGIIACASILPFALLAGYYRGIPFYWQMIDCSFGVVGGGVMWYVYKKIKFLETLN